MAEHPILTAQITRDVSGVTLYCPELNIHTSGNTEAEVRRKFVDALFEYYQFLEAHDFKNESPYKEHYALLTNDVLPSLADASLRSPHKPRSLPRQLLALLRRRGDAWDADLDALALDDETFFSVLKGDYQAPIYDAYLRTVPKNRLMPPAMRK